MRHLLVVLSSFLFWGCTTILVDEPIGQVLEDEEVAESFIGKWYSGDGTAYTVTRETDSPSFKAVYLEDGSPREYRFVASSTTNEVHLLWIKAEEDKGYIPLRLSGGQDSLALLFPDSEEVEALIEEGLINGERNDEDDSWLLAPEGLEAALESKRFWQLGESLPLLKDTEALREIILNHD